MNIDRYMDLNQLAERMGDTATESEARTLRDLLIEAGHEGSDTSEIAEAEWAQHLCQAVEIAHAEVLEAYTLNDQGSAMLADWVRGAAKHPENQNLDAWATEAEDAANNASQDESIIVEMRGFMTNSGKPETLTLPRTAFDQSRSA